MYIKMQDDKSLLITVPTTIYRGETNADLITFLLPSVYGDKSIADCTVSMRYVLPDGTGYSDTLALAPELYKTYCQYVVPVDTKLTALEGKVTLWVTAVDAHESVVIKTGETVVTVRPSRDIAAYFTQGKIDQLDLMDVKLARLECGKADNLVYDKTESSLRLSAMGAQIGDSIILEGGGSGEIGAIHRIDGGGAAGI